VDHELQLLRRRRGDVDLVALLEAYTEVKAVTTQL
jgi:hypothetical protein